MHAIFAFSMVIIFHVMVVSLLQLYCAQSNFQLHFVSFDCNEGIQKYKSYQFMCDMCHNCCKCVVLWSVKVCQLRSSTSDFSTEGFCQGTSPLASGIRPFLEVLEGHYRSQTGFILRVFSRRLSHKWVCRTAAEV